MPLQPIKQIRWVDRVDNLEQAFFPLSHPGLSLLGVTPIIHDGHRRASSFHFPEPRAVQRTPNGALAVPGGANAPPAA